MYAVNAVVQDSNLPILPKREQICMMIDKNTGGICGETDSLQILDEFRKLYEARIEKIDSEPTSEFDRMSMKCQIMTEWIKDLGEQNVMLVNTVKDLEQTATDRVKLLEEKLKQSSNIVTDKIVQSGHSEEALCLLSNRISELENDEECFRQRIEFLQSDIKGLIELIKRAQNNSWSLDDIKFYCVNPSDIPSPLEYQTNVEDTNAELRKELIAKEETIKTYISEIQNLNDKLNRCSKQADLNNIESTSVSTNSDINIILMTDTVESNLIENLGDNRLQQHFQNTQSQTPELVNLQYQLKQKNKEIEELKLKMASLQKEFVETYNVLTAEIVKKHDSVMSMRKEITDLNMQTNFKNDIIKEMRKELKQSSSKVPKTMNNYVTEIPEDTIQNRISIQQCKLMEEFHTCTVEVQAATEDIREEINTILSSFPSQHQKYKELNKMVRDAQEQFIRMQETISQAINKLELQEIKRVRYIEQIMAEEVSLKDIKNEFFRAQSGLLHYVNEIQEQTKEHNVSECAEMYTCNDLLNFVVDKAELILNHIQMLQNQECSFTTLTELKDHLCCTMCTLQSLQKHMNEILPQSEMEESILCERERRLGKLETEIDNTHMKMQDTLEILWNTTEQCDLQNYSTDSRSQNETINELLKTKEDMRKLRKEYHDFKVKMLEKTCQAKSNDKINQWKCRAIDLEDQLRILQYETKCKQETNQFLKNSIKSLEKKLCSARTKAESYRHSHSIDNMDYRKKILELENTIKIQKEVETKLKKNLDSSEIELQKSRELLESFHAECNLEGLPMCCGYQSKHESTSQLVNILQEIIQSAKNGLQDIGCELKKQISEGSWHPCTSSNLIITVIDKVKRYEEQLDKCYDDIENLRNTLCSKDKLLKNMNQVVMIQNDSIAVTQNELKSLYKKQQEKIDMQDLIIAQYEKEKKELSKQNELQAQTIGHLQNAVVEAKRCIDNMGHKTVSDMSDLWSSISSSPLGHGNVHDV